MVKQKSCQVTTYKHINKCVRKTHIWQTPGGSYTCVQHPRRLFKDNIPVADYMPLSSLLQEAQLLQRDRKTLLVIEYFSKSLKITQGHSKRHC